MAIQKVGFYRLFLFVNEQIVVLLQGDIVTKKAPASEIFAAKYPRISPNISI